MELESGFAQLVSTRPPPFDETRLAVAGFLACYSGNTRAGYASDLRGWFCWCAQGGLEPFAVLPVHHMELYARWMEEDRHLARATIGRRLSTIVAFYRFAVIDGFMTEFARRARPAPQDRHRVNHAGPGPHGAGSLLGPGRRRVPNAVTAPSRSSAKDPSWR
jgi:hypothetical protein